MAYATKQDMINRYGEEELIGITDIGNPPLNAIDDARMNTALENATAEINSEARLSGTITQTEQLANLCCTIARYRLTDPCPERVRKDYEDALVFLRRVSSGSATLAGQDASEPAATGNDRPVFVTPKRVFTSDSMKDL